PPRGRHPGLGPLLHHRRRDRPVLRGAGSDPQHPPRVSLPELSRELSTADRQQAEAVRAQLARARRLLFITGAGLPAAGGLPPYRGVGGLYDRSPAPDGLAIEDLLSGEMLESRPELTWKYLLEIERATRGARPSRAHQLIAAAEARFERVVVLTQNVDG